MIILDKQETILVHTFIIAHGVPFRLTKNVDLETMQLYYNYISDDFQLYPDPTVQDKIQELIFTHWDEYGKDENYTLDEILKECSHNIKGTNHG